MKHEQSKGEGFVRIGHMTLRNTHGGVLNSAASLSCLYGMFHMITTKIFRAEWVETTSNK